MEANSFFHQHAGFVNEKAVGISAEGEKGVQVISKKATAVHQPGKAGVKRTFGSHNRKYVYEIQEEDQSMS